MAGQCGCKALAGQKTLLSAAWEEDGDDDDPDATTMLLLLLLMIVIVILLRRRCVHPYLLERLQHCFEWLYFPLC